MMAFKFKQFMTTALLGFTLLAQCAHADELSSETPVSTFVGKSKLIQLTTPVSRVAVGDTRIADYKVVSPTELFVLGKAVGTTNLNIVAKRR